MSSQVIQLSPNMLSTGEFPVTDEQPYEAAGIEIDRKRTLGGWARLEPGIANDMSAMPEAIFRTAIDSCPFGILLVDALGKIVLANDEMKRIFGYTNENLIGQSIDILVPTGLRAQSAQCYNELATHPQQSHRVKTRRLSGRRKDGTEVHFEAGLRPIHTNAGIVVLAAIVDISERLHIERLKDEFVATVSHELRTPLTSIAGALGLLINDAGKTLPAATMRLLTIANANSQRLVRLVNSILEMEKIKSGKVVFALKRVEVRSLVEQAIEANNGFASRYGVRVSLAATAATGVLRVDPDWLLQVITNLLSNAIKFSPRNSEVLVTIESRKSKVRISVRDHGHGVPENFKGRIFEKFAQANTPDSRQRGGTGLGLSIVKQIVTRLGGEVSFGDAPGGGAIFHVDLPGWQPEIAAASDLGEKPNGPAAKTGGPEAQW
jgi:PAS domain S-box-containing protein